MYKCQTSRGPDREGGGEFWRILELEITHLIDTNLSFLTFLGDLAGGIEMPGRLDCGLRAVCWTLLIYIRWLIKFCHLPLKWLVILTTVLHSLCAMIMQDLTIPT